jgi:hypothetical protein
VVPPTTEAEEEAADAADPEDDEGVDEVTGGEGGEEKLAPAAAEGNGSRGSLPFVVAVGVAIGFALLATVMTVSYIKLRSDKSTDSSDRTTVATTASRAAEAMTSLDASGPNKEQADVIRQLGTDPFIEQYVQGIESIRKLFGPLKVTSERGTVTNVYVSDIEKDQAEVIVVVDLVLVAETPKVVPNQYLRVHLAKLSGQWKVDNVEDLNVSLAASGAGTGSTTTTPAVSSGTGSSSG